MEFELTDELVDEIIFAMEDQGTHFLYDSLEGLIINSSDNLDMASERYYVLPEWSSVEGFRIMERFVSLLHNPIARSDLRAVLFAGKGVFRNFKNVLKDYPEVERLWFSFKDKEMKMKILRWYNVLRDLWGVEKLGDIPEETDEELLVYFTFRDAIESDEAIIDKAVTKIERELRGKFEGDLGSAFVCLWKNLEEISQSDLWYTLIAESLNEEFSGSITVSPCPETSRNTAIVTTFFVLPEYRGLGIGKELLRRTMKYLKDSGFRWMVLVQQFIPETFMPALKRNGFTKTGAGFTADLLEFAE